MTTEKTIENAHLALPFLVHTAQKRQTLTYKELTSKIGLHHRTASPLLGYIRDTICLPQGLPMLTAIVVNSNTGQPGDSFLAEGTSHLSAQAYTEAFQRFRDQVFEYPHWDDVLRSLGLRPIEKTPDELDDEGREYAALLARRGATPEGQAHLQLKAYVARHPEAIDLRTRESGQLEYAFVSGDECDVVFDVGAEGNVVVEIKNGHRGELVKGVYQAVKYRALMAAEKGHGAAYPVRAFLVAYEIPEDITNFARRFEVQCQVISRAEVEGFKV